MCRENTHDIGEVCRLLGVTSRTLRSQARAPENGTQFNTGFTPASMKLTAGEYSALCLGIVFSTMISLPLYPLLALFFGGPLKIIISIAVYFLFFAFGAVVFRVRHIAQIRARLDGEAHELEGQRKREELGRWK